MTDDERIEMMRKRHAFFSKMVEGYYDLHKFFVDNDERFAIMGMADEIIANIGDTVNIDTIIRPIFNFKASK